jgi:hypothetical protein
MKTVFELENGQHHEHREIVGEIKIIGARGSYSPYVAVDMQGQCAAFIPDKDLERFAVNILKALKSKRLKQ